MKSGLATVSAFKLLQQKNNKLQKLSDVQLKKLQRTLLEILRDIDGVCKRNNIRYALGGGSVLGAVRHDGFIPWDDDVDIDIERCEYEKLKKVFNKELGDKYWFHDVERMNKMGLCFARIRKKGTVYRAREDTENDEAGVYVDLFIIENTYNSALRRKIQGYKSLAYGLMVSCRNFAAKEGFYMDLAGDDKEVKKVFRMKIRIGKILAFRSVEGWAKAWDKVNRKCKDNGSRYVVVPVGRKHFFGELYERGKFCETVDHKFENLMLPIPRDYDGYLKHMYGDYMKIPKKEDRETHVFLELKI